MAKKQIISRYTAEELRNGAAGPDLSNWDAVYAKTQEQIEADADSDDADDGMIVDWTSASADLPQPKAVLNMRIDRDVLEFFKTAGKGYQTKINAVLRAYKEAHSGK